VAPFLLQYCQPKPDCCTTVTGAVRVSGSRSIVALDTGDLARAEAWAAAVAPHCGLLKVGLQFFAAQGPAGIRSVQTRGGRPIFLDLKLHDIPNTVRGAVRAVLPLGARMLTVHAAGGAAMIEAARREAEVAGADRPLVLAVTVLTSLDAAALHQTGVGGDPMEQAVRLARMAVSAGADGVVCSAHEVRPVRAAVGAGAVLVVPGIRPVGAGAGDQARTMTPRKAVDAGADWIVVGRPVTEAAEPAEAARAIAAEIG
jgi:orotidine-5'-phosphate decarboxylase